MFFSAEFKSWKFVQRVVVLLIGLFLLSLGNVFCYRSEIGMGPWNVLHQGIDVRTPLTFGMTILLLGCVIVFAGLFFGIKPGIGTVINMLVVGPISDILLSSSILQGLAEQHIIVRICANAFGVFLVGIGTALYIAPKLGAGPRDSVMLLVHRMTKQRIAVVRVSIEVFVLVAGMILGGTFGIGTFIFAFGVGPSVEFGMWIVRLFRVPSNAEIALSRKG